MNSIQVIEIFILLNLVFTASHLALIALRKFGQEKWTANVMRDVSQYLVVAVFVFSAAAIVAPLSSFQTRVVEVTRACLPWLEEEVKIVKPEVIVCMGATATEAIFEKKISIKTLRSKFHKTKYSDKTLVTIHPSSILRVQEPGLRDQMLKAFIADLIKAKSALQK